MILSDFFRILPNIWGSIGGNQNQMLHHLRWDSNFCKHEIFSIYSLPSLKWTFVGRPKNGWLGDNPFFLGLGHQVVSWPVIIPYIPGTLNIRELNMLFFQLDDFTIFTWKNGCFTISIYSKKMLALGSWRVSRTASGRYWSLVGLLGHQWTDRSLVVRVVLPGGRKLGNRKSSDHRYSWVVATQAPFYFDQKNLGKVDPIWLVAYSSNGLWNHQLDSLFWLVGCSWL